MCQSVNKSKSTIFGILQSWNVNKDWKTHKILLIYTFEYIAS